MKLSPEIDWSWVRGELFRKERIKLKAGDGSGNVISKCALECLKEAQRLARPRSVSIDKRIVKIGPDYIEAEDDLTFYSRKLPSYVKDATCVHIYLVTIGGDIEDLASKLMSSQEELSGYLLDSIGSLAVESLAEDMEYKLREHHTSKAKSVSMRLSPGYCDWSIEEQRKLAKVLDFSKAGVHLNEKCMMVPRKSISAFVAIGPEGSFGKRKSQCVVCDKKDCSYRRR